MSAMDYDSTTKFITSLAKFLQSLCNGYVDFNNWVQINGHLILSVDSGETKEFVVNEKLCKTLRDNISFLSNSYHAPMNNGPMNMGSNVVAQNNNLSKPATKTNNDNKVVPVAPTKGRGRKQAQPQKLSQDTGSPPSKKAKQYLPNENNLPTFLANESPATPPTQEESEKQSTSGPCVEQHSRSEKEQESSNDADTSLLIDKSSPNDSGGGKDANKLSSDNESLSEVLDYSTSNKVKDYSTSSKVLDYSASSQVNDYSTSSQVNDDSASNKVHDDSASNKVHDDSTSNEVQDYSTSSRVQDYSASSKVKDESVLNIVKGESMLSKVNEHSTSEKPLDDSETEDADTDENETDAPSEKKNKHSHSADSGSAYNSDTNCMSQDYNPTSAIKTPSLDNKPVFPGLQPGIVPQTLYLNDNFCPPPLPFVPPQLFGAGLRFPPGLSIPGFGPLPPDQADVNQIPFTMPFGGLGNTLKVKLPFPTKAGNIRQPSGKRKKSGGKPGRPTGRKHQIQSDKISTSTSKSNEVKKEEEFIADIPIKEEIEEPDEESISPLSGSEVDEATPVKSRRKQSSSRSGGEGMDDDGTPKTRHNEPLSAHAVSIMSDWFYDNVESPYPSRAEMVAMAREGGIEIKQVKSWFANKRNRTNNTKPKVQVRAMEEKLLEVCQDLQKRNTPAADNSQILLKLSEVMSNLNTQKE